MAKELNRDVERQDPAPNPPSLPANFVQQFLYKANGYYYYSASCCPTASTMVHWGIIVSNLPQGLTPCPPPGDELPSVPRHTQYIHYPMPGSNLPNQLWDLISRDTLVPNVNVGPYVPGPVNYLQYDFGNVIFLDTSVVPAVNRYPGKMFQLRVFEQSVSMTQFTPAINFIYRFGVADKCQNISGNVVSLSLDQVANSSLPTAPNRINAGKIPVGQLPQEAAVLPVLVMVNP